MNSLPVSVHILTWNSSKTLEQALQSVLPCAEKLIIDGGSTDDTLKIAEKYGAKVIAQRPDAEQGKALTDFSIARNQGLNAATQPWILALDSDEYASEELMEEVARITQKDEQAVYYVPRKYVLEDGSIVEYATTYPNERMYFFHKDAVIQWVKPVHERIEVKAGMPVHHLKGASLAPIGTVEEYKLKNLRYLQIEIEKSKGKSVGHWFKHRLWHTFRSRMIALVKLILIWIIPRKGKRLPLKHELVRFWYGWKLIAATFPRNP